MRIAFGVVVPSTIAAAAALCASASAQSPRYGYTVLAETSPGGYSDFVGPPVIDDAGACLTESVSSAGVRQMLWLENGASTVLADDTGSILNFHYAATRDADGAGLATYTAHHDTGVTSVYLRSGGVVTEIVRGDQLPQMGPSLLVRSSVNSSGSVEFVAMGEDLVTGIGLTFKVYRWSAGALSEVAVAHFNHPTFYAFDGVQVLEDGSTIVTGQINPGAKPFFGHISVGGALTVLATTNFTPLGLNGAHRVNDGLVAAYIGGATAGKSIVRWTSQGPALLASAVWPSAWESFKVVSINNPGRIVFTGEQYNNAGGMPTLDSLHDGLDPIQDRVLVQGEPLFGSAVAAIDIGTDALNDAGQIAMRVALADGRRMIVRADPLPPTLGTRTCEGSQACPCGNESPETHAQGCANSNGRGSRLTASGSTSLAANDLVFTADELAGNAAVLFAGASMFPAPHVQGDGLRCIASPTVRFGLQSPTFSTASWGPGLALPWLAGDTRTFQAWYRNGAGSPCPTAANSNLSSAVTVTFTP